MKKNRWKIIACAAICVIILAIQWIYYALLFLALAELIPLGIKLAAAVVPTALSAVIIGVTASRIKEIRSGAEDDLSKY